MLMLLLVAVVGEAQVALEVITTEITDPAAREEVVNVGLLLPTFVAPFFHWYEGLAPPFTGVAVKVTGVPALEQMDVEEAVIDTDGVTFEFTVAVIAVLEPVVQPPEVAST